MGLASFNPRTVLRQTSNGLLEELFGRLDVPMRVAWGELAELDVDPIFEACQKLDDRDHDRVDVMLRDLHLMTGEDAQRVIFQQVKEHGQDELLSELERLESRYDMVAIAYLESPMAYAAAMRYAKADRVVGGRSSQRRVDLPPAKPLTSPDALAAFSRSISAYYTNRQGRGRHCHVEYSLRRSGLHYWFVSLDDYPKAYLKLVNSKHVFERRFETHAFEIVFAYDETNHFFDIYAKGGKSVHSALQPIFAREILGIHLPPEDPDAQPFMLSLFLDPAFTFPTFPQDMIQDVVVRGASIKVRGSKEKAKFEPDEDFGSKALQQFIDVRLNEENLPRSLMELRRIELKFRMANEDDFAFAITSPNRSSLKSLSNRQRELAEQYLKYWGVTRASDTNAASAA